MHDRRNGRGPLSAAECVALAAAAAPIAAVLGAYVLDFSGAPFPPWLMLAVAAAAMAGTFLTWIRGARRTPNDSIILAAIFAVGCGWLLFIARPMLLPLGTGPDLTHHLLLIDYIETHWRLVHDPGVERFLGEMAQYTPGSHIVSALAGAWSATDGLHALHAMQSASLALKACFLYLICVRMLPEGTPRPLALAGVVLTLASPRYLLGSFTEYGFIAQVVAELFVLSMWWMTVVWDASEDPKLCVAFGFAGAAAFLTWPVYVGPPLLAFAIVVLMRGDLPVQLRLKHLLMAYVPFGIFAVSFLVGRLGWLQLAGTGGSAPTPTIAAYGVPLAVLAIGGVALAAVRRQARTTFVFTIAVIIQIVALLVLAARSGAPQPYMALKMFYLLLWPMSACAALAILELWRLVRSAIDRDSRFIGSKETAAAWGVCAALALMVGKPLWQNPKLLHPRAAAISEPLAEAGAWARQNVQPECVEYLVGDEETAYWLHLAVLGNPRMSSRTGDNATFEPQQALLRWLSPGGLPYAIADLAAVPRDVRDEFDVVRAFGTAAVVRRKGPSNCSAQP
jgi:hypothetical protein